MTAAASLSPSIFASDDVGDDEDEAQRLCEAAAAATPATGQSLFIRVGARHTTAVRADVDRMVAYRILNHGPVILAASQAAAASASGTATARVVRAAAEQVAERGRLDTLFGTACPVVGTAGIARAVITLGAAGRSKATLDQIHAATETLGMNWAEGRRRGRFQQEGLVEPMLVGAAVLGAILARLGAPEIVAEAETPVDRTLEVD
jgi:hypothetical protein